MPKMCPFKPFAPEYVGDWYECDASLCQLWDEGGEHVAAGCGLIPRKDRRQ